MDKLEPCYSCGEMPILFRTYRGGDDGEFIGFFYACNNFDCKDFPESDVFKAEKEAAEDWNRRMNDGL